MYDCIIVGGGHAGCEAALVLGKLNKKTLLITSDLNRVATLSCNPSIGGPAKGVVVREIDALGGTQAKLADKASIQTKLLNKSKGPAVRAIRAQIDKEIYPKLMIEELKSTKNLEILVSEVNGLIIENKKCLGVVLLSGEKLYSKKIIITTGTYLNSSVLIGNERVIMGPDGVRQNAGISKDLKNAGFEITRLKTGTPARIDKKTIDYSKLKLEKGDDKDISFSFYTKKKNNLSNLDCYLTFTNSTTHKIIMDNLDRSPIYSGIIEGIGPRYCPSIEDKVVKFNDKNRHQVFIEPESINSNLMYLQGLSSSMPRDTQRKIIKSVKGLENAKIIRYGYAIEYDGINPIQIYPSLETKLIKNLYTAGQINGTSGYEEAACQGLMAAINVSLSIDNKEPLILKRNEAYIGVLIDDLVTKGTKEPYRLLTSRAEHRLLLRSNNADLRLSPIGYKVGLLPKKNYNKLLKKKKEIKELLDKLKTTILNPTKENLEYFKSIGSSPFYEGYSLYKFLKRPEIGYNQIKKFINKKYNDDVIEEVIMQVKYQGYINKQQKEVDRMLRLENKKIPKNINYDLIHNLASEARQKLKDVKPQTLSQASRIIGVNPSDIQILTIYIEQYYRKKEK